MDIHIKWEVDGTKRRRRLETEKVHRRLQWDFHVPKKIGLLRTRAMRSESSPLCLFISLYRHRSIINLPTMEVLKIKSNSGIFLLHFPLLLSLDIVTPIVREYVTARFIHPGRDQSPRPPEKLSLTIKSTTAKTRLLRLYA